MQTVYVYIYRCRQQLMCASSDWDDDDDGDNGDFGFNDEDDQNDFEDNVYDDDDDDDALESDPKRLMSSGSTENLQHELSCCIYDGLSDKENTIQEMKQHVKYSTDHLKEVPLCF